MNCKNCKHWDERQFDDVAFTCHTPGMRLGECMMAAPSYVPEQAFLAVATCRSEGIYGDLITQDRFGCIQFTPKPVQK